MLGGLAGCAAEHQTDGVDTERNVLGGPLESCGGDPVTGFYRDGSCHCGPAQARHLICTVLTRDFLEHQRSIGNDLLSPAPEFGFPGLRPGDRWCVVVDRWLQSYAAGVASPVVLAATNEHALEVVDVAVLRSFAVDVPDDLSGLDP
jgi:uncharacterized protein